MKQKKAYEDGESKREIDKKLLEQNINIEIIMTTTGLSKEEIEKLV